ncbi:MAG: alpha/beta hydrolase [Woeseiaceae bacterium]
MTTVVFSHGQESGPWGSKIRAMAELAKSVGCRVESIDYQGIADPTERVNKLIAECADMDGPLVLVGSSMGGHVATAAAVAVNARGLFVLAPAYFMEGFEALTPEPPQIPISIVHGWNDDIVPVENSIRFASACQAELHILDSGHRLTEKIDEINYYLKRFIETLSN